MTKRLEHLSNNERLTELGSIQPGEEVKVDLIKVYEYLMGGVEEGGARLFSVVPCDKI